LPAYLATVVLLRQTHPAIIVIARIAPRKAKGVAKVAAARRLAVRLYWMLRSNTPYPEIARIESSSR
jgi:hypothetical protein